MPKHTQKEIVRAILTNGRPYKRGITSEGSAESGPISYWFFGFRWGRTEVEVTQSGTLFLQINIKKQGMAGVYRLWGSPVLSREITPENQ
nr:hypothetical protein [Candidatus Thorarchaeota archaeon]